MLNLNDLFNHNKDYILVYSDYISESENLKGVYLLHPFINIFQKDNIKLDCIDIEHLLKNYSNETMKEILIKILNCCKEYEKFTFLNSFITINNDIIESFNINMNTYNIPIENLIILNDLC